MICWLVLYRVMKILKQLRNYIYKGKHAFVSTNISITLITLIYLERSQSFVQIFARLKANLIEHRSFVYTRLKHTIKRTEKEELQNGIYRSNKFFLLQKKIGVPKIDPQRVLEISISRTHTNSIQCNIFIMVMPNANHYYGSGISSKSMLKIYLEDLVGRIFFSSTARNW